MKFLINYILHYRLDIFVTRVFYVAQSLNKDIFILFQFTRYNSSTIKLQSLKNKKISWGF